MPEAPLYFQKGFGLKSLVREPLEQDYRSAFIDRVRANGHELAAEGLTIRLAKEFGFCYGVERTVDYAYQALLKFPGRRIFITDEIIHNPFVNERLIERGVRFLFGRYACGEEIDRLGPEDIVILPAFGVTAAMMEKLKSLRAVLVDTTCGSVLNVWKNVERYARDGFTAVVHGKYDHEETRATVSQALKYPSGRYVVVRDLAEADLVCDTIVRGGDRAAFLRRFEKAVSPGFDPDRDLERVALANQTTMLMSESLEIERRLRRAIATRYGEEHVAAHLRAFDTICSATQDRQDAVAELLREKLDLMIVIGGYNSSNTGHLAEMAGERIPTYHIQGVEELLSADRVRHRDPHSGRIVETPGWLPAKPLVLGLTAGASTPNSKVGEVIERILELRGLTVPA
ncbi:MAG: 4-hydroxy-3-methylbut-2-enyl diphosphate reductase [Planctomycetes bacterium]|nr:4-hydroxy-3-methylbut-2-enyl diphosphate reductase [Planctomycetota bacterium]